MLEHLKGFTMYRIETNPYASITQKCHLDIVLNLLEVMPDDYHTASCFATPVPIIESIKQYLHLEGFLKHKER